MIQNVLRHLGGIENYGIISLCLFFFIFTVMVVWAMFQHKTHLDHMAHLPLDNDNNPLPTNTSAHE